MGNAECRFKPFSVFATNPTRLAEKDFDLPHSVFAHLSAGAKCVIFRGTRFCFLEVN
jgi:hypothetical protein